MAVAKRYPDNYNKLVIFLLLIKNINFGTDRAVGQISYTIISQEVCVQMVEWRTLLHNQFCYKLYFVSALNFQFLSDDDGSNEAAVMLAIFIPIAAFIVLVVIFAFWVYNKR